MKSFPHHSEEFVETVLALWKQHTALQISDQLGLKSRNKVIGIVARARQRGDERATKLALPTKVPRVPKPRAAPKLRVVPRTKPMVELPLVEPGANAVEHHLATDRQCRFFMRGQRGMHGLVCGNPTDVGSSWCPHHETRVWNVPPPRQRVAA